MLWVLFVWDVMLRAFVCGFKETGILHKLLCQSQILQANYLRLVLIRLSVKTKVKFFVTLRFEVSQNTFSAKRCFSHETFQESITWNSRTTRGRNVKLTEDVCFGEER